MPGFIAAVQPSITVPIGLTHLYYICFLSGFAISASVYCTLHFVFPTRAVKDFVVKSAPAEVLMREYQERWDGTSHGERSGSLEFDDAGKKMGMVVDREARNF
jgi:NCS1 family nucleobase:cation symporter-1